MQDKKTSPVSLYKLRDLTDVGEALSPPEEAKQKPCSFTHKGNTVQALLCYSEVDNPPSWSQHIKSLTTTDVGLKNTIPSAVLVLKDSEQNFWALCWGYGYRFVNEAHIDTRFGLRLLARTALPGKLRGIEKHDLDRRGRSDRTTLIDGGSPRDLGIEGLGELVNTANAKIVIEGLTACSPSDSKKKHQDEKSTEITVKGGDSLKLRLATSMDDLLNDLKHISRALKQEIPDEFQLLDQLTPIRKSSPVYETLEDALTEALSNPDAHSITVRNLHTDLDFYGNIQSYKISGIGDNKSRCVPELNLNEICNWLGFTSSNHDESKGRLERLRKVMVDPCKDAEAKETLHRRKPLTAWLLMEHRINEERYCLFNGKWYRLDTSYAENIERLYTEIFQDDKELLLPQWKTGENEDAYNQAIAEKFGGVCLDRKLAKTKLHAKQGIELCDVYIPSEGTLIHVKRADSSSMLSHLYAQCLVSCDSLVKDEDARRAWGQLVEKHSSESPTVTEIRQVWVAMRTDKKLSEGELFTFSKVTLVRLVQHLQRIGIKVKVARIPIEEESSSPSTL